MNRDYEWYPKIGDTIQTSKDAKEWSEPFIWQGGDIQVLHNYWREPPSTLNPMTQSIEQQAEERCNPNKNQMITQEQKKWKLKMCGGQIADTGDYDGHIEISNGKIVLTSKEDDEEKLQELVDFLNKGEFDLDDPAQDDASFAWHQYQEARKQLDSLSQQALDSAPRWVPLTEPLQLTYDKIVVRYQSRLFNDGPFIKYLSIIRVNELLTLHWIYDLEYLYEPKTETDGK